MSPGVRGLGPPGVPPAPSPVQSGQLDEGETGPLPGGPPTCLPLWKPDSQQPPADIQDHLNPELPSWAPTGSICSQDPRPQHCSFHCSPQVGRELAGHPNSSGGPGGCMVTVSAAFQGSLDQVRTWQDLVELPTQNTTPSPLG